LAPAGVVCLVFLGVAICYLPYTLTKIDQTVVQECQRIFQPWKAQHNILAQWTNPIPRRGTRRRGTPYIPGKLTIVVPLQPGQQQFQQQQFQQVTVVGQATAVQVLPVNTDVKLFQ